MKRVRFTEEQIIGVLREQEAVADLRTMFEMSERRPVTLVGADRTMIRYRSRRPNDAALRASLRDLAHQRHRFGYRRLIATSIADELRGVVLAFQGVGGDQMARQV